MTAIVSNIGLLRKVDQIGKTRTAIYDDSSAVLVVFDAVVSEAPKYTSKITSFPAEDGIPFSDLQVNDPIVLNMSIVQTNHPSEIFDLSYWTQLGAGLAGGLAAKELGDGKVLTPARGAAVGTALAVLAQYESPTDVSDRERPDRKYFDILKKCKDNSTRLTVVTPFNSYNNMLLKDIEVVKNKNTSQALVANLVFQEVQIYSTESKQIEAKGVDEKTTDEQQPTKDQGTKKTTAATAAQAAKAKKTSILAALVDLLSGLFS